MPLHVSSTCVHHHEVKIALHSLWYHHSYTPPPQPRLLILVTIKPTDDDISPSLHNRINLINTNTLSDENLMIAEIGRNM